MYDNFYFLVQILTKIVINFSDFSLLTIYVIVVFNLDYKFFRFMTEITNSLFIAEITFFYE